MLPARRVMWMFPAAILLLGASTVSGQDYPNKPIRVVTSGAGGGNDRIAREIAQAISGPLGQPVTVENLSGGIRPGEHVFSAPADGYTVLIYNNTLWIGPLLQSAAYDAVRDFAPVSELARTPNVLVVGADSPAKSVAELIALTKARPGELRRGSLDMAQAEPELETISPGNCSAPWPASGSCPSTTRASAGPSRICWRT